MSRKVFLPKMPNDKFSENQVEVMLHNLKKEYGLSKYQILCVRFWCASHSLVMGALIDPDNKEVPCSSYNKDMDTLLKEHPDCGLYTLKGVVQLQATN